MIDVALDSSFVSVSLIRFEDDKGDSCFAFYIMRYRDDGRLGRGGMGGDAVFDFGR